MNASIISVTENGRILSQKICDVLSEKHTITRYAFHKNCDEDAVSFFDINSITADILDRSETIIVIGACGIAVRSIAPFIKSKTTEKIDF